VASRCACATRALAASAEASYVRDRRIPLELCPTSNVQTGAVGSIAEHPFGLLASLGFRVTINTDNRLMSDTSLTKETFLLRSATAGATSSASPSTR